MRTFCDRGRGRRERGRRELPEGEIFVAVLAALALCTAACDDALTPSTPTHLDFTVEPGSVGVGSPLAPSVAVAVRNERGHTVAAWSAPVTVSLEPTGVAVLGGTATAEPVGGTAVFDDLVVDVPGADYRLVATSAGLTAATSRPFTVHEAFEAAALSSGPQHTCALTDDGTAYCWGRNDVGQLGDGSSDDRPLPTPVDTELRFAALSAGGEHTCGLTADGTAYCWGMGAGGALGGPALHTCAGGSSALACSMVPTAVAGGIVWDRLEAGWYHTCGIARDGAPYCWGEGVYGQLGSTPTDDCAEALGWTEGATAPCSPTPTALAGTNDFMEISAGYLHSCALTADGEAWCWGSNIYGEVGDGTQATRHEPAPVHGGLPFASISAGGGPCHGSTCGVADDGSTYCWGRNYQRSLAGNDLFALTPLAVVDDPGFTTVSVGANGICGLQEGGALHCWGDRPETQVGGVTRRTPFHVRPDLSFTGVSMGQWHACAVAAEGRTYCWGLNTSGQLGNLSSPTGWDIPVMVWKPPPGF
jgi:alpha-tubulin suppressor-like RCC1 family protein